MGTHPIFESDFDCLTEMGIFKQIGAALSRKAKDPVKTAPSVLDRMKDQFNVKAQADQISKNKEDAFAELENIKLAPIRVEAAADALNEEEIDAKLRSLEREKSTPKELEEIERAQRASDNYLPKRRETADEPIELPRGKAYPPMLVDVIYNHQINPQHWNVENLAAETRLRESDVEMFLKNFDLINEHSNIFIEGQGPNAIAGEEQFSPADDMPKQIS